MKKRLFSGLKEMSEKVRSSFFRRPALWTFLILAVTSLLLFLPSSFDNFFHTGPDWEIVSTGETIFPGGGFNLHALYSCLGAIFTKGITRSLDWVTWIIDYRIWGLNAQGYFIENILLHVFNSFLVFLLLDILFKEKLLSLVSAFIFCVHPINAIVPVDISGRPAGLCAFFYLGALVCFCRFLREKKPGFYLLSLFSALCAFLSKETAFLLPLVIILTGAFLRRTPGQSGRSERRGSAAGLFFRKLAGLWIYLPYFILAALVFIPINSQITGGYGPPGPHSWWYRNAYSHAEHYWLHIDFSRFIAKEYFLLIPHMLQVLAVYVFKKFLLVPWDTCRYLALKTEGEVFYASAFLTLIVFAAVKAFLKKNLNTRILFFGAVWVFINALPILGTCTDLKDILEGMRHLYLVSAGYSVIVAWLFLGNKAHAGRYKWAGIAGAVILCLLLVNFVRRTIEFTSSMTSTTIEAKKFVFQFRGLLRNFPEKGNIYFLTNRYDPAICGFLLSDYPRQIRKSNFYYVLSGTDICLEKAEVMSGPGMFAVKQGFNLAGLDLGNTDFVFGWDGGNGRLVDFTGKAERREKNDGCGSGITSAGDIKNWKVSGEIGEKESFSGRIFISPSSIRDALSEFRHRPKIASFKVDIPAGSLEKIIIEMRILPHIPLEKRFAPGRIKESMELKRIFTIEIFKSIFISPFDDEMMFFSWIPEDKDDFNREYSIGFVVQTDNEFHTYELFPGNSPQWLKSGRISRFGLSLQMLFDSEIEIRSIKFICSADGTGKKIS
ncbi:MAG: glycosyltransferase family 39 protein [Candidatus Omnitrophota bacterium]